MTETLTRTLSWDPDLRTYLASAATREGEIGTHDCVLFCAGAVRAMTGWEPEAALTQYTSIEEGEALLVAAGYESLTAYLNAHFPAQPLSFARPGDLVLLDLPEGPTLGLVQGELAYVPMSKGLGLVALKRATACWKVG